MNLSLRPGNPNYLLFFLILMISLLVSCNDKNTKAGTLIHFTSLRSSETGITFNNKITENDSVNLVENEYTYMGGGVGIGDFNNDGLQDIFFSASQQPCKLYLNKGKFLFRDITVCSAI